MIVPNQTFPDESSSWAQTQLDSYEHDGSQPPAQVGSHDSTMTDGLWEDNIAAEWVGGNQVDDRGLYWFWDPTWDDVHAGINL